MTDRDPCDGTDCRIPAAHTTPSATCGICGKPFVDVQPHINCGDTMDTVTVVTTGEWQTIPTPTVTYSIYENDDGWFSIAHDQVWVPGLYDSPETAIAACSHSNLADLAHVWRDDGEARPATMADLERLDAT